MSTKDLEAKLREYSAELFGQRVIVGTLRQSLAERDALIRELYDAIDNSLEYLDATIGPCDDGCECLLHDLHAAVEHAKPHLDAQTPDAAEVTQ